MMRPRPGSCRRRPTCSGCCAGRRDHRRGDGRAGRLGEGRGGGGRTAAPLRAPRRREQARVARGVDRGLLDPAGTGGHLRALARNRRNRQRREEPRRRGRGDADRPRTRRSPRWPGRSPPARESWAQALELLEAGDRGGATAAADAAVKDQRRLQHTYREAMSALVDVEDPRELTARRELYRRIARAGDELARSPSGSGTRC